MTSLTVTDARTIKIDSQEAWDLIKAARSITTTKGDKVQNWNPHSDDKSEILRHVMGPSGNLRAPTLQMNNEFIVGFNVKLYENRLGKK